MSLDEINNYQFIFVAGLHRSGTTLLGDILKQHPSVAGLEDTGVSMNEGQLVQSVYPAAFVYGGPGKFGFAPQMHLTEQSTLVTDENRIKLFQEWGKYLDLSKPIIVEKSPPNLIKTRFLQALFPNSLFVIIKRHPIAVTFATKNRWKNSRVVDLISHWVTCHEIYENDKKYLNHVMEFTYSEFVTNPNKYLHDIYSYLGLQVVPSTLEVKTNINNKYFTQWERWRKRFWHKKEYEKIISQYEAKIKTHGFSLSDYS